MTRRLGRAIAVLALLVVAGCGPQRVPAGHPEWQTIGELARPRAYASAVALANGKILVVGGLDRDDPSITNDASELVDPRTGTSSVIPGTLLGRLHQSITPTWEDLVVVAGGVEWAQTDWDPVDLVDVYHPSLNKWVAGARLNHSRSDHAATALHDGRIFITGGNAHTILLSSTEIYDPRADEWLEFAPMPRARTQAIAVTLIDGRVLVTGGLDSNGAAADTTFIYDPRTDSWSDGPVMTTPRLQHVAVGLPTGDVLVAGGDGLASGTSELFDFKRERFVPSGMLVDPRLVAQAVVLADGRVVMSGGMPTRFREFIPLRTAEVWSPKTGQWTQLPSAPTGRAWVSIVVVRGVVYQLSGTGEQEIAYRTIERLALD